MNRKAEQLKLSLDQTPELRKHLFEKGYSGPLVKTIDQRNLVNNLIPFQAY